MSDVTHTRYKLIGFEDLMQTIVFESGDGGGVCRRPVSGALRDRAFIDRFAAIHAARIGVATERVATDQALKRKERSLIDGRPRDRFNALRRSLRP